ncbi:hypothetical protein JOC54_000436 [Alkalihalobacillus xiaoxiensis]|uniref:Uncharacterized protein n=1 Tax=Shouchella xiaoxiensis TaxID=766895 RepID=A0ABS2SNW6_9BACI|nr:hypothetical protein [Shouchella xiaoxiensis]MBM7837205.1 hypothetical protein [Shouchella xiaoxiensis]
MERSVLSWYREAGRQTTAIAGTGAYDYDKKEVKLHYDLFQSTTEYSGGLPQTKAAYVEDAWQQLQTGNNRILYLKKKTQIISACATVSEDKNSAIVIGVVTALPTANKALEQSYLFPYLRSCLPNKKHHTCFTITLLPKACMSRLA